MKKRRVELDGFFYELESDNTAAVDGCSDNEKDALIVPTEISFEGKCITINAISIRSLNLWCGSKITIGSTIENIRDACFEGCKGLCNVVFDGASQLREIGFASFRSTQIKSFRFSSTVERIHESCFAQCKNLSEIVFESPLHIREIGEAAFHGSGIEQIEIPSSVKILGDACFHDCRNLRQVTFSKECQLSHLGRAVFSQTSIETIQIRAVIQGIGKLAFAECKSLSEVLFEADSMLVEIGNSAFFGSGLKYIRIPPSVQFIRQACFCSCGYLCNLVFDSVPTVRQIENLAFAKTALRSIIIPSSVEYIGAACFWQCSELREVLFESPCRIKELGKEVFSESGIMVITIPDSFKTLNERCFYKCVELTEVKFESDNSLQEINNGAFAKCGLRTIAIPLSVRTIGDSCFCGCESLSEVILEDSSELYSIGKHAFYATRLQHVHIPAKVQIMNEECFAGCRCLTEAWFESRLTIHESAFLGSPVIKVTVPTEEERCYDFGSGCVVVESRRRKRDVISEWLIDPEDYQEIGGLGEKGNVKLVRHKKTRIMSVVKLFRFHSIVTGDRSAVDRLNEEFNREIDALLCFDHPCIVAFRGFSTPARAPGSTSSEASIVMEYLSGGSLKAVLTAVPVKPWWNSTQKVITIVGVVLAMRFVHKKEYIHRDLKPENILFDSCNYAKVADFGSSRTYEAYLTMTALGTPLYMAPEVDEGDYDSAVDVYAFGLILYEIITGNLALSANENVLKMFRKLRKGERPEIDDTVLPVSRRLITTCWSMNPGDRPTFEGIWEELEDNDFRLFDDVDKERVSDYVEKILEKEENET
jgi:tRNA A-37 threonylcarbamoyl transferase component Bud32